jgi:hypothetical protein
MLDEIRDFPTTDPAQRRLGVTGGRSVLLVVPPPSSVGVLVVPPSPLVNVLVIPPPSEVGSLVVPPPPSVGVLVVTVSPPVTWLMLEFAVGGEVEDVSNDVEDVGKTQLFRQNVQFPTPPAPAQGVP